MNNWEASNVHKITLEEEIIYCEEEIALAKDIKIQIKKK